jgi:Spy/CpxP family protein refolding chaperone
MEKIRNSKWHIRIAAILIFLLGFSAGALGLNVYQRWRNGAQTRRQEFTQIIDRLQLNSDQKTQVQQIFSDVRSQLQAVRKEADPRVTAVRQQTDEKLQKVLTPEQWQQFQEMRNEFRSKRPRPNEND